MKVRILKDKIRKKNIKKKIEKCCNFKETNLLACSSDYLSKELGGKNQSVVSLLV